MTYLKLPSTIASQQMNLLFDAKKSEGTISAERDKVVLILADDGLRCGVGLDDMPSSDAGGDWMRRMGANESGPADFPADRRRHVGHVRRHPRAVRPHHAGRRRHS
jgi:hypothetical protein